MRISKVRDVKTPTRGTEKSAGLDFYIPNDWVMPHNKNNCYFLFPGYDVIIPSGIKVEVPKGMALVGFNKSGVATKSKMQIGACVVDEDYQGEIHLHLFNLGRYVVELHQGDKIAQFILLPMFYDKVEEVAVEELFSHGSERGDGKFGSTGNN